MTEPTAPSGGVEQRGGAPRVRLHLTVRLRFDTGDKHRSAITADVSTTGMYVRFLDPPPVGTLVRFELDLPGRREPIRGSGEVAWIRVRSAGPDRPSGLGVRFRHLDSGAVEELERGLSDRRLRRSSQPGEVEWYSQPPAPPRPGEDEPVEPLADAAPSRSASPSPPRRRRPPASRRRPADDSTAAESSSPGAPPRQVAILAVLMLLLIYLLIRLA